MEDQDGTAIRELDAKVKGITVEFRAWDADVMRFLESNKSTAFIPIDVYPYHLSSKTALPQSALHTITTHAASPAAALALSNQWKEQESWARDRRNAGFYSAQRSTFSVEPNQIKVVSSRHECDVACAKLHFKHTIMVDTENVWDPANPERTNQAASIAQAYASDEAFIFKFNEWDECYPSFQNLMKDGKITKVMHGVGHDKSSLQKRWPNLKLTKPKELKDSIHPSILSRSRDDKLGSYVLAGLQKVMLYKSCNDFHSEWDAEELNEKQLIYAAADVVAMWELINIKSPPQELPAMSESAEDALAAADSALALPKQDAKKKGADAVDVADYDSDAET